MTVERERGISVSSAVMSFEHEGLAFNLPDTPVHEDFSPKGLMGYLPHADRGRQHAGAGSIRPQDRSSACPECLDASRHEGAVVLVFGGVLGQI
jgi:hypothetical protein